MDIYIDGNYSNIRFSAAHFIPGDWKCSRLHGHDYSISIKISGNLNNDSYFLDFSEVKSKLREIADYLDHKVLIPELNESMKIEPNGNNLIVKVGDKEYSFPKDECRLVPIKDSTAECLSGFVLNRFVESVNEKVSRVEVDVHEGPGQYARTKWTR